MAFGNPLDETLDQLPTTPGTAPAKTPPAPTTEFEKAMAEIARQDAEKLDARLKATGDSQLGVEQAADIYRLSTTYGLSLDAVERDYDHIRKEADKRETPYAAMRRQSPALTSWVAESPQQAAAVKDDMEQLGALEWIVTAPSMAFAQSLAQMKLAELRTKSLYAPLTDLEQIELSTAKFHADAGGSLGAGDSWFRGAVTGSSQLLANVLAGGLNAGKVAALGAGTGAIVGGAAGLAAGGAGAVPGAIAGAKFGATAGATIGGVQYGFELEAGLAYDEFLDFKDEYGQPLDPSIAKAAAFAAGAMNGGLELLQLDRLAKTIPGFKSLSTKVRRDLIKSALRQPTVRAALGQAMREYGSTLTFEVATEVAQRAVTIVSGELGKMASGQNIERKGTGEVLTELVQEGVGAFQGFGLLGLAGPTISVGGAQARASRAQVNVDFFKALGDASAASQTITRLPDAAQEILARATKDGPVERVYAPIATWTEYWQSKEIDPRAMATEITGNPDAYDEAVALGGDLEIATARYAVKLAGTDHNAFFTNELRLAPGEMNVREAEAFAAEEKAKPAGVVADPTAAERVAAQTAEKLIQAGVEPRTARIIAQTYEAGFGTLAERAGLNPEELYRRYGLVIERPDLTAQAPAGATQGTPGTKTPPAGAISTPAQATPAAGASEAAPEMAAGENVAPATSSGDISAPSDPVEAATLSALGDLAYEGIDDPADGATLPNRGDEATIPSTGQDGQPLDRPGDGDVEGRAGSNDARVESEPAAPVGRLVPRSRPEGARARGAVGVPANHGPRFALLLDDARASGFTGTDDSLADLYLDEVDEAQRIAAELTESDDAVGDHTDLLKVISSLGGLGIEEEAGNKATYTRGQIRGASGMVGELETLLEDLNRNSGIIRKGKRAGQKLPRQFRRSGGVAGIPNIVVRKGGLSVDYVYETVNGDPRWADKFETLGDFLDAVRDAIAIADGRMEAPGATAYSVPSILSGVLGVTPGSPWWADQGQMELRGDEGTTNNASGEPGGGSAEEHARANAMAAKGEVFVVYDRAGQRKVLAGVDAHDYSARGHLQPGETFGVEGPTGFRVLDDRGGRIPPAQLINIVTPDTVEDVFGEVDLTDAASSFDFTELDQGLFDDPVDPSTPIDILATGEQQPRLPGDVGAVRDTEVADAKFELPEEEFRLTAPAETQAKQTTLFQSAFHGSPHQFERFSLQAIGTGEGAQAYGWGLYFASKREVAEGYRDRLAQAPDITVDGQPLAVPSANPSDIFDPNRTDEQKLASRIAHAAQGNQRAGLPVDAATVIKQVRASLQGRWLPRDRSFAERSNDSLAAQRRLLEEWETAGIEIAPAGRLYTVELPDDDNYLDWDKPASEQSPQVQAALKALGLHWSESDVPPASVLRVAIDRARSEIGFRNDDEWQKASNDAMQAGMGGPFAQAAQARLDAFYRENAADITPFVGAKGQWLYREIADGFQAAQWHRRDLGAQSPQEYASKALAAHGVVGIRYLDGNSRTAGAGSSNYVVFDDRLVQITEFNQAVDEGLSNDALKEWAEELKATTGPDLVNLQVYLTNQGDISLSALAVARGAQRAGLGSRVMVALTRFADQHGARIVLSPSEPGYGASITEPTTSTERLFKFYRRFGFVRNAGRHKDFTTRETMYREPTANVGAAGLQAPKVPGMRSGSPEFRAWFKDSQVVDDNGQPLRVFHGSMRADRIGTGFKKSRATSGPSAFFTADPAVASKYAVGKQDTSLEAPATYAEWFKFKVGRSQVDISRAWYHLTPEQRATLTENLPHVTNSDADGNTEDSVRLGGADEYGLAGQDHWDFTLKQHRGNMLAAAVDVWLDSGGLFGQEEQFMDVLRLAGAPVTAITYDNPHAERSGVIPVFLSIQNPLVTDQITPEDVAALHAAGKRQRAPRTTIGADPWDKRTRNPKDWLKQLDDDLAAGKNSMVWTSIPDWVTDVLRSRGYDGIRDVGGKMGGVEHDVWVPFDARQIKSAIGNRGTYDPTSENMLRQDRRGSIRFGADRQMTITLFEKANLSTFLHETGHFYLEVFGDVVDALQALPIDALSPTQVKLLADYAAILQQFGVERRADITEAHHEEFARLFEAYLYQGTAPSTQLREAFASFRAWLIGVYRSLKALKVDLTPEVTGVFDRMLATDKAIADAQAESEMAPMFTTARSAGVSDAEFELYRERIAAASRTARETLEQRILADVQREREKDWQDKRDAIEKTVAAEIHEQPVYQALAAMQRGTTPAGEPLIEGSEPTPAKLDRKALLDEFGPERLKRLPRPYIYTREGGLAPSAIADMFGFASVDAMLSAVEHAAPMRDLIKFETDRRMLAEHGSVLLDGSLHERATAALGNEDFASVVRAEMRILGQLRRVAKPAFDAGADAANEERAYERRWYEAEARLRVAIAEGRKQREIDELKGTVRNLRQKARGGAATIRAAIPRAETLKAIAQAKIAKLKVRDIRPDRFWSASRRAATLAFDAAARGDYEGAITLKQQELMNLALFQEATKAKESVEKAVSRISLQNSPAGRQRLGKAGASYLDQWDGVLDRYSFAKASQKVLDRLASIKKWAEALEADGLPVELPAELLNEARRTPYQELTIEEFSGVTDGLQQIQHLARLKNKLLKAKTDREFGDARDSLVESIYEHGTKRDVKLEFTRGDEKARKVADWFASHSKLSFLARAFDGYQDGGAMWEHIIRPLNAASDDEQTRRSKAATEYRALINKAYPGSLMGQLSAKLHIPAIGASLTKEARLAVALNWGNETSRDRLLSDPVRRWNREQILAILDTLDERDWTFVQDTWDYLDTLWPEVAAKQARVTGVAPEKVEALEVVTKFGTMRGGYYPLAYDGRLVARAQQVIDASEAKLQQSAAYVQTTTRRGHVEARKSNVTLSVRLDLGVAFSHLDQVIHDLTHHEALIDVTRLLRDSKVAAAILATQSDVVYQQFTKGVQDIALGSAQQARGGVLDTVAAWGRTGTQISLLGWNLWTAMQQPLGLFNGMQRVGPKWVAKGMARMFRDAASMESTLAWVDGLSPFMASRAFTASQDLADLRTSLRQSGGWFDNLIRTVSLDTLTQQTILDSYLWHIGVAQRFADVPTWIGAYEKAMASDPTESRAVALADQAVIDSQGSGNIKDLAQVQRGGQIARFFMTFYSYGNLVFNQTQAAIGRTNPKSPSQVLRMLGDLSLIYLLPALGTVTLRYIFGKSEPDDDEPEVAFVQEVGSEMLGTALNTMVFVREFGQLFTDGARGYSGPAGARMFDLAFRLGNQVKQGEADEALIKALGDVAGMVFRFPAAQVQRTADGVAALAEGRSTNPLAVFVGAK